MGWMCHRIIDDSVFQYPGVRFPVRLFTDLKEIDFIGEKFLVPNPPEEYLRFKYGEDWMTPKEIAYEKDVVGLIPEGPISGQTSRWRQFITEHLLRSRTASIRVFDQQGEPVPGPEVVIAGLNRARTNRHRAMRGSTCPKTTSMRWSSDITAMRKCSIRRR